MQVADQLVWAFWPWDQAWMPDVLNIIILLTGIFLILLVLIQRGKGGGLAGAFGGSGGSSAFGTRAGDQFTRITIIVAAIWVLLIMLMVKRLQPTVKQTEDPEAGPQGQLYSPLGPAAPSRPNA